MCCISAHRGTGKHPRSGSYRKGAGQNDMMKKSNEEGSTSVYPQDRYRQDFLNSSKHILVNQKEWEVQKTRPSPHQAAKTIKEVEHIFITVSALITLYLDLNTSSKTVKDRGVWLTCQFLSVCVSKLVHQDKGWSGLNGWVESEVIAYWSMEVHQAQDSIWLRLLMAYQFSTQIQTLQVNAVYGWSNSVDFYAIVSWNLT